MSCDNGNTDTKDLPLLWSQEQTETNLNFLSFPIPTSKRFPSTLLSGLGTSEIFNYRA